MKKIYSIIILLVFFQTELVHAEEVDVSCSCKTKNNPSECTIKTQPFETLKWNETAFSNPDIEWTPEFLSEYCMRKKHDGCMCSDLKYYSGTI